MPLTVRQLQSDTVFRGVAMPNGRAAIRAAGDPWQTGHRELRGLKDRGRFPGNFAGRGGDSSQERRQHSRRLSVQASWNMYVDGT